MQDNLHNGAAAHHDQPWGEAQRLGDWRDDQVITKQFYDWLYDWGDQIVLWDKEFSGFYSI